MQIIIFEVCKKSIKYLFFSHIYKKMPTEYYQKIKEKLHKEARKRYQNFSKEKTEKKTSILLQTP